MKITKELRPPTINEFMSSLNRAELEQLIVDYQQFYKVKLDKHTIIKRLLNLQLPNDSRVTHASEYSVPHTCSLLMCKWADIYLKYNNL